MLRAIPNPALRKAIEREKRSATLPKAGLMDELNKLCSKERKEMIVTLLPEGRFLFNKSLRIGG
jgi:hypothetical protein